MRRNAGMDLVTFGAPIRCCTEGHATCGTIYAAPSPTPLQREGDLLQFGVPTRRWSWLQEEGAGAGPAGLPKLGDLTVRVSVVGRASSRWKTAKSPAQADRLNQRLSESRAQNIYNAVADIIKRELPKLPIAVSWKGVGSHEGFPTVGDDNPAIDRSVIVMVDLATTTASYKFQHRAPRRIYVPSKVWTLRVHNMFRVAALGYVQIFLRLGIINPYSQKEMLLSGWLRGGGAAISVRDSFKLDKSSLMGDIPNLAIGRVGKDVSFLTKEAMDFDDLNDFDKGRMVRLDKIDVSAGLRSYDTGLVFTDLDTDPTPLWFEHNFLTLGGLKADAFVVFGKLRREGPNPGDYLELPTPDDIIPTQSSQASHDGLLLTFPTEKADLKDLSDKDRRCLTDFVVNKARNIAVMSHYFDITSIHP
jgi:hypothetical protein